jgi:acetyltransferase-like isoleucine patch superfamily enzyme
MTEDKSVMSENNEQGENKRLRDARDRTELQAALQNEGEGAFTVYRKMAVGKPGLWPLIKYELIVMLIGGLPGALGYACRRLFYRFLLGSCGKSVVFGRNVVLRHPHKIHIGDRVIIDDDCVLDAKRSDDAWIQLGDGVLLSRGTVISCGGQVEIGANCNLGVQTLIHSDHHVRLGRAVLLAARCYLMGVADYRYDRTDVPVVEQGKNVKRPLILEDHVWLGAGVFVRPGVTVGNNAIVAVNSVVTRDVASYSIVAGAPARVVKRRQPME